MEWIFNLILIVFGPFYLVNGRSHDITTYDACEDVPINTLKIVNETENCGIFIACIGKIAVPYKCLSNSVYGSGTPNCLACDDDSQRYKSRAENERKEVGSDSKSDDYSSTNNAALNEKSRKMELNDVDEIGSEIDESRDKNHNKNSNDDLTLNDEIYSTTEILNLDVINAESFNDLSTDEMMDSGEIDYVTVGSENEGFVDNEAVTNGSNDQKNINDAINDQSFNNFIENDDPQSIDQEFNENQFDTEFVDQPLMENQLSNENSEKSEFYNGNAAIEDEDEEVELNSDDRNSNEDDTANAMLNENELNDSSDGYQQEINDFDAEPSNEISMPLDHSIPQFPISKDTINRNHQMHNSDKASNDDQISTSHTRDENLHDIPKELSTQDEEEVSISKSFPLHDTEDNFPSIDYEGNQQVVEEEKIQNYEEVSSHKSPHISNLNDDASKESDDYPATATTSEYEDISISMAENLLNDKENYVIEDDGNSATTIFNENYLVNDDGSISSNIKDSNVNVDDIEMENAENSNEDSSLEFIDENLITTDDGGNNIGNGRLKSNENVDGTNVLDDSESNIERNDYFTDENSVEMKSITNVEENADEYQKIEQKECYVFNENGVLEKQIVEVIATNSTTTEFPKINLFSRENSNTGMNIESKFDNGSEIINDENSSNVEAISESFTMRSTSFEVENSQFTIDESSENFENSLIRKSDTTEIDEDGTTQSSTPNHELLFSEFFESQVTRKLFTKIRKVKRSRPIMSTTTEMTMNVE